MRVVATTGMPGAGKSLAVEVARDLAIQVVSMGDLVREAARRRGLPDAPESFGLVATEVRQKEGAAAWAERTLERVRVLDQGQLLIDGVRNLEEVEVFRREFPGKFTLIAVLASPATRYERMGKRGRGEDAPDTDRLRERDAREIGYGLGGAIAMADIYVDNESDRDEARSMLRAILAAGATGARED